MSEQTPPKEPRAHARIPAPILWVQDHLLLALLMVGSGVINARFLVYGLVPDLNNPLSWGVINTVEIVALACAGMALGGLEVRISYKLGECIAKSAWGRALFLMFGITVLAFIEFWASYSQRSQNIPITPADHAFLSLLNLANSGINITAMCIATAIPFLSVFWGFAAEDPAPEVVEDPETVKARLENELMMAEYNAKKRAIVGKGLRAAGLGILGREDAPKSTPVAPDIAAEATAFAERDTQEFPAITDDNSPAEPRGFKVDGQRGLWWDATAYQQFIWAHYHVGISPKKAMETVQRVGGNLRGKRVGSPGAAPFIAQVSRLKQDAKSTYGEGELPSVTGDNPPAFAAGITEQMAE